MVTHQLWFPMLQSPIQHFLYKQNVLIHSKSQIIVWFRHNMVAIAYVHSYGWLSDREHTVFH